MNPVPKAGIVPRVLRIARPLRGVSAALIGLVAASGLAPDARAQAPAGWVGNFARNPGFEEDFVNAVAEGHVLSFKGDWYYNQKDLVPDYWTLTGNWSRNADRPRSGRFSLKLGAEGVKQGEGARASQVFPRAVSQSGGGAWGGSVIAPHKVAPEEVAKVNLPWRATAWCRGGGKILLAGGKTAAVASAPAGSDWTLVTVELPGAEIASPATGVTVILEGPGEFDDVTVEEQQPAAPNLAPNRSFEQVDAKGRPVGWSEQLKYRAIGPTYYVWTDWNHAFRPNRGAVVSDPLVARSGSRSLRFDVHPGDEKLVESDLLVLNQDQPRIVEVGVFVRADRINLLDLRCVDQDGVYMPAIRSREPEYTRGGTFLFGNGTFGWRYVRKFFATPGDQPVKGIRVRLCARGFNGHVLDDSGTRPYCMQVGTVWFDDLYVAERTTDAAALRARGATVPAAAALPVNPLAQAEVDLGERFWGENVLTYKFVNQGPAGPFQLKVTTTLPGGEPVVTTSAATAGATGAPVVLAAPYRIDRLAGELEKQGTFAVEVLRGGQSVGTATYAFNTWPVVVDVDVSRSYNLPAENPVTTSLNLGVSQATLARTKTVELQLVRSADRKVLASRSIADLPKAFAETLAGLPATPKDSLEFNLPTPAFWVDRTNLLLVKLDLTPLTVWPHDRPTRDTVLVVRGLDAAGQETFRDASDPFGRVQPPPAQPPISSVAVREDGAVLINGQPRFLFGATHQNNRMVHTVPIMAQLGLMGHRLTQGFDFAAHRAMWTDQKLYSLQMKPGQKIGGTVPVVDLDEKARAEFEEFCRTGGMQNVISINTGGWEATINPDDPAVVAKHSAFNDWVRKVSGRPVAVSTSGAYNAWWIPKLVWYDINHAETEMWGPMDFDVIFAPYMKRAGRKAAWVYLPQLYDNTPFERYRFETYENIVRGSAGTSMIQGIGDATFNRGLAGELRYLDAPLNSTEPAPAVTLEPNVSHRTRRHQGKTYVLATNAGPIQTGEWTWNAAEKFSGRASHEGDSVNQMWVRPGGVRIHGFRGLPLPEPIRAGDKIVQHVRIDPAAKPEWVCVAVRGDGKFVHNAVLGGFDFEKFRAGYGNVLMFSELNHSVWHDVNWVMDDDLYKRSVRVMGQAWADGIRKNAQAAREKVDATIYRPEQFKNLGPLPAAGTWHRIEIDAQQAGLVGKLVDGFAYLEKGGKALWDHSVLERDGKVVRVFCEDTVGIDRALLDKVRVSVPGLKAGTKVEVLFENRTIVAEDGGFTDDFRGIDTYGYEGWAVEGDLFGFVKDEDRELPRMIPSGHGYKYGPTAVHIYEIAH